MRFAKVLLVIIGAIIITAFSIDATDTLSGKGGTLLGQLVGAVPESACPPGMIEMSAPTTFMCVDAFEASPDPACGDSYPGSAAMSAEALGRTGCAAASQSDELPWTYITRDQAALACAQAGKRLPSAAEWYQFAIGTPDDPSLCNVASGKIAVTGQSAECTSAQRVKDAVGNAWEWTSDDVLAGQYAGRTVPDEGYVMQVDNGGVATETSLQPSVQFGSDYFWSEPEGNAGLMRGGFYGSRSDAGIFAVQAATAPTFAGEAVGFRCVK